MKILIGMTRSDTLASGSFKHIVQIGERFRKAGCDVAYVIGKMGPVCDVLSAKGFVVYSLAHLERNISPAKDLFSLLELIKVILQFNPDICSWHTAKIGALGRIASAITLRKSFYVPHGVPFFESKFNNGRMMYRRLEKLLSYLPTNIVGVCRYDTEQYLKLGLPKRKTITIHNGMRTVTLPTPNYSTNTKRDGRCIFMTAARFENQKDYQTLAKAIRRLSQSCPNQFELHIYGDGPQESHVRELFKDTGAPVLFKAVIEDLTVALLQADVFVLSSHWEGLPRTIIEAMSCRLPVIATDVGGVNELITHGQSGFLVAPLDDECFADAMAKYVNNLALCRAHADRSYSKFCAEFTLEDMVDKYMQAYVFSSPRSSPITSEQVPDS
jgi:glycosyltransferase involved in cell wall biosynthesis